MIAAGVFHDGPGITVEGEAVILGAVVRLKSESHQRVFEGDAYGLQNRHGALTL